jgi:hypothetical protein
MSLPTPWVDRIFHKLTLAYGRDFVGRWEGIDLNDVKTDWAHELSGFMQCPDAISYALANLPHKAPSVIEFRALARKAPLPEFKQLEAPKADAEKVALEIAKQIGIKQALAPRHDPKEWAKRIINRASAGEKVRQATLRHAREALGI